MRRMLGALASLYRRWRYVEEGLTPQPIAKAPAAEREPFRTQQAIERGERLLADYRRNGCDALANEWELRLRSLRIHLAALRF